MKKLILAAAMTLSAASAFANYCEAHLVDRYGSVRRVFPSYDSQNGCKEAMKECSKTIRMDSRYSVNTHDCVRANDNYPNPNPNPGPQNPYPYPDTNPYPQYGVTVNALIEDSFIQLNGRDAADLYYNCLSDIRRIGTGSADELFFTVNGNNYKAASTSGWYNETTICSIFEQEARLSGGYRGSNYSRVVGSLENVPFQFEGSDRGTLLNSCISEISRLRIGSTDELSYSLNGSYFQRLTTSGWWNSPARVCKALLSNMNSRL